MKFNKVSQDYKKLNMVIREEMRCQKISQSDLAYRLNLGQSSISEKLAGKTEWTVWEMMNVFEILGITFDYRKESNDGINEL